MYGYSGPLRRRQHRNSFVSVGYPGAFRKITPKFAAGLLSSRISSCVIWARALLLRAQHQPEKDQAGFPNGSKASGREFLCSGGWCF